MESNQLGMPHLRLPMLSSDLNPIEHMRDALQRRLLNQHPREYDLQQLSVTIMMIISSKSLRVKGEVEYASQ